MLESLKQQLNTTYTENGAVTLSTTTSACLDLFATAGALRNAREEEIIKRFSNAFSENPDMATKILFYARDIRGGLGERRFFRIILKELSKHSPKTVIKNLENIAEYGRYDDLLTLLDTPCREQVVCYIGTRLNDDIKAMHKGRPVSLLAKWLPSVNATNSNTVMQGKRLARYLNMNEKTYRKLLSALRSYIRILENDLRQKNYTFNYENVPAKALCKYRRAFYCNDGVRFEEYLEKVKNGSAKINTNILTPYDIVQPFYSSSCTPMERRAVDIIWNNAEDFTRGENALVVADGSGSMYWSKKPMPAAVAQSLAVYFAERNEGPFANHFITFSENPQLVEVKGADIFEKIKYCSSFNEVANTNLEAVFDLILNTAKRKRIPQSKMPQTLYIISDMEFDVCVKNSSLTNFEYAKRSFSLAGYKLPQIVFWNVNSCRNQQPVSKNEQGVILVSGCSPRIFSAAVSGNTTPEKFMLDTLNSDRYKHISA